MQSKVLRGDVQKKGTDGVWRTVLTAAGFAMRDYRYYSHDDRLNTAHFVRAPYVPGKTGAFMPPYFST